MVPPWAQPPWCSPPAGGSDGDGAPSFKAIELNIAHINDHHSQLEPIAAQELTLDGVRLAGWELGGLRAKRPFSRPSATPQPDQAARGRCVITGTQYYTFFKGKARRADDEHHLL